MPEARRRRTRAPRPLKWLGKGIGSTAKGMWRVVRRDKRRTAPMASISAAMLENCSPSDDLSEWSSRQDYEPLQLQLPSLPSLQQLLQLPAWLAGFLQAPAEKAVTNPGSSSSISPTSAVRTTAGLPAAYSSNSSSSSRACFPPALRQQQQQEETVLLVNSSRGSGVQLLGEMLNLKSTFPMLLHTVSGTTTTSSSSSSSSMATEHSTAAVAPAGNSNSSGSGIFGRPQQLLTVGCRNWGNWWDGRGLLRVKIYDFAIYVDGEQAERFVPTLFSSSGSSSKVPSLLDSATALTDKHQQQHAVLQRQQQRLPQLLSQHQHQEEEGMTRAAASHAIATSSSSSSVQVDQLPDLLKSHRSGVGMSLILRAARDVPLHLLSEEYEKVLKRRLARAGGDASDAAALQQLLATFSDPMRLPPAVRGGKACSSSSSSSEAAGESELEAGAGGAAGGGGGSVAKGAMLVFERSGAGTITARVGPHILGAVHSPKLAEALFDLYLGDQPVSKTAKDAAAQTLNRIAASIANGSSSSNSGSAMHHPYYLPQSKVEEIKCEGLAVGGLGRKGSSNMGGLGLGLSDLAACVLHMG